MKAQPLPSTPEPLRTQAQNKAMHALAGQLAGLELAVPDMVPSQLTTLEGTRDVRWLRLACLQVTGQPRSSVLTTQQAFAVIEALRQWKQQLERALDPSAGLSGSMFSASRTGSVITPKQQNYIQKLLRILGDLNSRWQRIGQEPARQQAWAMHYLGLPWPQSHADADVFIEAAKSMVSRSLPTRAVLEQELLALQACPTLSPWGRTLLLDAPRRRHWGPLQWAKLHQLYLENHHEAK